MTRFQNAGHSLSPESQLVQCFLCQIVGSLFPLLLVLFSTAPVHGTLANGEVPILLKTRGQQVDIELHDITEGIGVAFKIVVVNMLGEDFDALVGKNSCSCLNVVGVEGKKFGNTESVELVAKVGPTPNHFSQKCSITGQDFACRCKQDPVELWFDCISIAITETILLNVTRSNNPCIIACPEIP